MLQERALPQQVISSWAATSTLLCWDPDVSSRQGLPALVTKLCCVTAYTGCSHKKKRMRQIKKMAQRGLLDPEQEDPFSLFVASTEIRYCYYHDTHKILGNTFGMCVLQVCLASAVFSFAKAQAAILNVVWFEHVTEESSTQSCPPFVFKPSNNAVL